MTDTSVVVISVSAAVTVVAVVGIVVLNPDGFEFDLWGARFGAWRRPSNEPPACIP